MPEPTEGAPVPEPTEGAPIPEPTEGTPIPQPTEGAPIPEPTEGAPIPEPTLKRRSGPVRATYPPIAVRNGPAGRVGGDFRHLSAPHSTHCSPGAGKWRSRPALPARLNAG
jgi:hypothetical protein